MVASENDKLYLMGNRFKLKFDGVVVVVVVVIVVDQMTLKQLHDILTTSHLTLQKHFGL